MTRKAFLILLALALTLSVGLVACGGIGEQEEEEEEPETYDLTISSTDGGSVTTPGEGTCTYDQITVVDLVAEAEDGYRFVEWTGDVATIGNVNAATTIITTDNDYSITANFVYGPAIPPKNPGSFVQMTMRDVASLDPAWLYDPFSGEQVQYMYETLLFFDGEEVDEFVPVLATEWELLDDHVTYRFKIREGVEFHEGGDLTPSDVEYSFERAMVQDRDGGPIWNFYLSLLGLERSRDGGGDIQITFGQIDHAIEVDDDWVVFHLVDPTWDSIFLQILCLPWASIVDKEWCIANGEWDGTEETWEDYNNPSISDTYLYNHTNGTGPWKLEAWDLGVEIKLVRNDDYWREPAAFEEVITQVVGEWTTRKEALLAGDVDLVYASRMTAWNSSILGDTEDLEGVADLIIYKDLPMLVTLASFFNMAIAEDSTYIGSGVLDGNGIPPDFFTDIDVRKGFSYAFDYETFIKDGWLGEAQQLGSPVCEGFQFYNPDASTYSLDLDKAAEHLQAAWDGELWEKGCNFTLLYNAGSVLLYNKVFCELLADNLAAINPKFRVNIQPTSLTVGQLIVSRALPVFDLGWVPDWTHPDNILVPFMASYATFAKWQGYGSPELDAKLKAAFEETDPEQQQAKYYELQERYYEDAPSSILWQLLWRCYFTKYIEGCYYNPFVSAFAGLPLYYMSKSES